MNTPENSEWDSVESTDLLAELDSTFELFERVCRKEKERFGGTGLDGHLNLILGCTREAREKIASANT